MKPSCLCLLVLISISCISNNKDLYEIDPRTLNNAGKQIYLADIAEDIKYIPLDDNIPFINFKYVVTPDFLYVSAKDIGILKFDRDGRLIKQIGRRGRGPGEFMYGILFTVDTITGNVFVEDRADVIKVYSQNGTFISEFRLNEIIGGGGWRGDDFEIFNSLLFFPNSLGTGNSKYCWAFLDTLGNLVSTKKNSVPPFMTKYGRAASFYKFENKLFYFNYFNDTIFSISPDLSHQAEYTFAQGDFRWPKTNIEYNSISDLNSKLRKLFQPSGMFETKRFIVIPYIYQQAAYAFIEKKTKKIFLAFQKATDPRSVTETKACITNNLDGGLPLERLQYYSENDEEYFTSLITPFNLKMHISGSEFKNSRPEYPEKKKELEKFAGSLKETGNPVLVMVRLKH